MPSKIRNDDWERLFAPNAFRRGGPLRALLNVILTLVVLVLIALGSMFLFRYRDQQRATAIAAATVQAATIYPLQTATAAARASATATRLAEQTAAAQPTAIPTLGSGSVLSGGNLRSEPRIAPDTVVGLIWPGDQITFLEQRDVGGQPWFRIQVTRVADNREGPGVEAGTEGWASASLLSPPTP